jgi:hypothetical protein
VVHHQAAQQLARKRNLALQFPIVDPTEAKGLHRRQRVHPQPSPCEWAEIRHESLRRHHLLESLAHLRIRGRADSLRNFPLHLRPFLQGKPVRASNQL